MKNDFDTVGEINGDDTNRVKRSGTVRQQFENEFILSPNNIRLASIPHNFNSKSLTEDAAGNPCTLTCSNGGACQNDTGTAVCNCVNGYTGSSCENGELNILITITRQLNFSKKS